MCHCKFLHCTGTLYSLLFLSLVWYPVRVRVTMYHARHVPDSMYQGSVSMYRIPERSPHCFAPDSQLKIGGAAIFPGADCHQSSTIPSWPLSRGRVSRLRLTQQSLKRVGHEGKLCLKVEQRHPPCLSEVPLS